MVVSSCWGDGEMGWDHLMSVEFQCFKMKGVLKKDNGDACTTWIYVIPLNCPFKNSSDGKFHIICILLFCLKKTQNTNRQKIVRELIRKRKLAGQDMQENGAKLMFVFSLPPGGTLSIPEGLIGWLSGAFTPLWVWDNRDTSWWIPLVLVGTPKGWTRSHGEVAVDRLSGGM